MRLLIVEDEVKLSDSLKRALTAEGYAVDIAHDGRNGYQQACDESYDLYIFDIGLPHIHGLELTRRLRTDDSTTPIILLTARDTTGDKIKGLDCGADDYVVKPFDFDELLARIRALLRRGETTLTMTHVVDTLTLNPQKQQVFRSGKEINLSTKEYSLLEYLLRNKGNVVNKQQIIDHVWNSELNPFSNIVDVYIGYLRKKIDTAFPQERGLLHTYKGRGYVIK